MAETTVDGSALVAQKPAEKKPTAIIVHDDSPLAYMLDTAKFEHLYRIATVIARASLTPKHLKTDTPEGTIANCFRVVNQAMRWGMDPFAVIDATYAVGQKLGYEGKLVAAVVNARAGLKGRLSIKYKGDGQQMSAVISGHFADEAEPREVEISVAQARTQNEMWTKDPAQKLWYAGATKWARRHCPDVLLGVMTDDELADITNERISNAQAALEKLNGQPPSSVPTAIQDRMESTPPMQDNAKPAPTAENQDADAPAMSQETEMVICDEMARTGRDQDWLKVQIEAAGAQRFQKLTETQAAGIFAELRKMPDKGTLNPPEGRQTTLPMSGPRQAKRV